MSVAADVDAVRGVGRQIKGPTALGTDPRRLLHLTWALAVTDFRLRSSARRWATCGSSCAR